MSLNALTHELLWLCHFIINTVISRRLINSTRTTHSQLPPPLCPRLEDILRRNYENDLANVTIVVYMRNHDSLPESTEVPNSLVRIDLKYQIQYTKMYMVIYL